MRPGKSRSNSRSLSEIRLVNGSTGDPALYLDDPGRDNAILIDTGENAALDDARLGDLEAVFITHHHVDHFIGFDRIIRANLDRDKALNVFGPVNTIGKVYNRIKSYEYPFFPFQKIVLNVHEIVEGKLLSARLECAQRFPRPKIVELSWEGPTVYRSQGLSVEAAFADHTVPCLAFAVIEETRIVFDKSRLVGSPIAGGTWVQEVQRLFREGAPREIPVVVSKSGETASLGELQASYFETIPGSKIAYVTDTAWSEVSRPGLLRLAQGARRLYCDSFYAAAQSAQAEKYRHMTATQAAEFARDAGVEQLVLIHFATRYQGQYEALVEEARAIFPNATAEIPGLSDKKRSRDANSSR